MSPPSPCSIMIRAASRETRKLPFAITSCCRSQSCSVVSSSGLEIDRPALLTTRSTPPKASAAARNAAATASASLTSAATPMATSDVADLGGGVGRLLQVQVGDDDAGALGGQPDGDRLADARRGAGDQRDAGRQRLGLRHPRELGLLQRPVLDAELLALVDRRVGRDRLGAAHHVDRVDVELAGDAGGLLVRAEAEHADAGHQHDRRVGAAHRRAVRGRVPLRSRRRTRRGTPRAAPSAARRRPRPGAVAGRSTTSGRTLVRRKWSGQRRAQRGQPRVLGRGQEVQDDVGVGEVPDLRLVGARQPADHRRQRGGLGAGARPRAAPRSRAATGAERLGPCRARRGSAPPSG